MISLNDIPTVKQQIDTADFATIKKLCKLLFNIRPDRTSRQRVRKFTGFEFEQESDESKIRRKFLDEADDEDIEKFAEILNIDKNNIWDSLFNLQDLKSALRNETSSSEESSEEESSEEESSEEEKEKQKDRRTKPNQQKSQSRQSISIRDVEDSLRKFDGKNGIPIEKWIEDIELEAEGNNFTNREKFILARKLLTGRARTFYDSRRNITTWSKLKETLLEEFENISLPADIHKELANRKIQRGEEVSDYFITMCELASRGNVDNQSLLQYVLEGIPDIHNCKSLLYGATTFHEFKKKILIYEKAVRDHQAAERSFRNIKITSTNPNERTSRQTKSFPAKKKEIRCYNCGDQQHLSTECPSKDKGAKCFNCHTFGHKSFECPAKKNRVHEISTHETRRNHTNIKILGQEIEALVDTGSSLTLVTKRTHQRLQSPQLKKSGITLTGLGGKVTNSLGYFQTSLTIDEEEYPTQVYVVENQATSEAAIIGDDILKQVILTVSQGNIKMEKVKEEYNILNINIADEPPMTDIGHELKNEARIKVEKLIQHYEPRKTKSTNIEMKILLKDDEPVYHSPRRLPFTERTIVDTQVEEWIKDGVVEPCNSEYASQVIVTRKKCGTPRICIDYRKINKKVVKDRFPLPLIEDQLDKLQDAKLFTTIDLKNGFFHVAVEKSSRKYTAFVTHRGHFQFLKVPFGLCNSPAVFQRFVNSVFQDLIRKDIVLPYMDDLIIPAKDEKSAIQRLQEVFQKASEYGLTINMKKCQFIKRSVEFLGHRIEDGKLYPSEFKTKAVKNFPDPKTIKQVQSFLGLTGYFRKFIEGYSIIAKPLSDLLKGDRRFQYTPAEKDAFEQLKTSLMEKPVLRIYHQGGELELHTDASQDGLGAILLQRSYDDNLLHPVYYVSKKTTDAERKYSSYELEVLAIIYALNKLRIYLLGHHFKIITDCSAFQKTMDKRDLSTKIARWALLLEDFDYVIEHRPGHRMRHVDALSRHVVLPISESPLTNIQQAQENDENLRAIKKILEEKTYEDYFLKNNIVYKMIDQQELLVIPENMQDEIIRSGHENGHFSIKKTTELLKKDYFIPKLEGKIERFIMNCVPCILANRKQGRKEGFLHPLTKESRPLHTYHIDHLGPLESTNKNYKHIFVVVDSFTKFVWLYPTKSTSAREVIQKLELQRQTFGSPANIFSDRGTAFTAQEFEDYCTQHEIQHFKITTGLPRVNGQVERINSIIIPVLAKLSIDDPAKWYKHVDEVQRAINSTYQRSINTTPFELLTGVKMKTTSNLRVKEIIDEECLAQFQNDRDALRRQAKEQINRVQEENRRSYNLRRRPPNKYQLHELVAIKRTQSGPGLKLKSKYLGPYRITKVKPSDTYDVEREGFGEGPSTTSTCAEYMKPWNDY